MVLNNNLFCPLYQILVFYLLFLHYGNKSLGMPVNTTTNSEFVGIYGNFPFGDIVLPNDARTVINSTSGNYERWPEGKFYYQFSQSFPKFDKTLVTEVCMKMISDYTCIQFIEGKAADGSYVEFVNTFKSGCYANSIGKRGGRQEINLGTGCVSQPGLCVHEIMHSLGFFHEVSRPDRDKYIKINENNIRSDAIGSYLIMFQESVASFGAIYDYGSIMHFHQHAYTLPGANGQPSKAFEPTKLFMTPWVKLEDIGQKKNLTYEDIYQIQRLYNCCGVAWNYNTSATRSLKSSDMSRTVTGLETSAKSKKVKNHAKFPFVFAQALCKHHLKFIQTKDVQGLMKEDTSMGDDLHKKNVVWKKCSSRDPNCQPFLFEDRNKQHDADSESDPGEYGDYFQGDLINNPSDFNFAKWTWPYGYVPYVFEDHVGDGDKLKIFKAMHGIEKTTCIKFREILKTVDTPHLVISTNQPGCFTNFGFNGMLDEHVLNLNSAGCLSGGPGVATHELLHVIGMQHEHTKLTRDHWLTIKRDNVKEAKLEDFNPLKLSDRWSHVGPVDYGSIMMVPNNFRANGPKLITIEPKEDIGNIVMGQREQMTAEDISRVLHLYECCTRNRRTHGYLIDKQN